MFHITSLEGATYGVPLESLRQRKELKRIERTNRARKVAGGGEPSQGETGGKPPSYAERAYRAAIQLDDEQEPLLHAFEIMSSPVITVRPELKVDDAWAYFQRSGVRHMPVLSGMVLAGIVSERDLLVPLARGGLTFADWRERPVSGVMASPVVSASRETDIRRIARAMFENRIGAMPILDDQRHLVGIITRSDILYALVHHGPLKLWG
ncbi:MAG TPA: CBS domain-containing protein [Candidatus Aminicenantes bacterium]|nr:CBS domain-containing protein [Candidatus Aminicenantes bacterium]